MISTICVSVSYIVIIIMIMIMMMIIIIFADLILTEVETGMPCAIGTAETSPVGSYVCQYAQSMMMYLLHP